VESAPSDTVTNPNGPAMTMFAGPTHSGLPPDGGLQEDSFPMQLWDMDPDQPVWDMLRQGGHKLAVPIVLTWLQPSLCVAMV